MTSTKAPAVVDKAQEKLFTESKAALRNAHDAVAFGGPWFPDRVIAVVCSRAFGAALHTAVLGRGFKCVSVSESQDEKEWEGWQLIAIVRRC